MKYCPGCDSIKPVSEFHKNRSKNDGLAIHCKVCKKIRDKAYADRNRDRISEQGKTWYAANKERASKSRSLWYSKNREQRAEYYRRWRLENPELERQYGAKKRALKRSVFVETVTVAELRKRDGDNCYLCLEPLQFEVYRAVHIEHRIPLSRGGEHSYANTALACSECNGRKHKKTEDEYRAIMGLTDSR